LIITETIPCINCGTNISVFPSVANVHVCGSCFTVMHNQQRLKLSVKNEDIGIPIGAKGKTNGKAFVVSGALKYKFENHFQVWWLLVFENKETTWLVDKSQQKYLLTALQESPFDKNAFRFYNMVSTGTNLGLFMVTAEQKVEYRELYQGSLDISVQENNQVLFVAQQQEATYWVMQEGDKYHQKAYKATPVETNTIEWEQPIKPIPCKPRQTNCGNCKKEITIQYHPFTVCYVCNECRTAYAVDANNFGVKVKRPVKAIYALQLNESIIIKGITYTIISRATKKDQEGYTWKEYGLQDAENNQQFLSEYKGHWILLTEKIEQPLLERETDFNLIYKTNTYTLFNSYTAECIDGDGEFFYNPFGTAPVRAKEFIAPPHMWVQEKNERLGETTWLYGEHIAKKDISVPTSHKANLPLSEGVGAIQPIGIFPNQRTLLIHTLLGSVLIVLAFLLTGFLKEEKIEATNLHSLVDSAAVVKADLIKFKLDNWRNNVEIKIESDISNTWLEVNGTLLNKTTGDKVEFEKGIEKYSGVEDGESWTEGDNDATIFLSSLEAGEYIFEYAFQKANSPSGMAGLASITVVSNTVIYRNFWIAIGILCIISFIYYLYLSNRERVRWQNSPYYDAMFPNDK
jgi:uncharacterized membrane protein